MLTPLFDVANWSDGFSGSEPLGVLRRAKTPVTAANAFGKSKKWRDLQANPRAAFVVDILPERITSWGIEGPAFSDGPGRRRTRSVEVPGTHMKSRPSPERD